MMQNKAQSSSYPKIEKALTLKYALVEIKFSPTEYRVQLVPEYEYRNSIPYHTVQAPTIEQALDSLESKL